MLQKQIHLFLFLAIGLTSMGKAFAQQQTCTVVQIVSATDHQEIPYAYIQNKTEGTVSVADGNGMASVCSPQRYINLLVKQLGYDTLAIRIRNNGKQATLHLNGLDTWLDAIDVVGNHKHFDSEVSEASAVHGVELQRSQGKNLGEIAKMVPGVSAIQSGPGIYKPVIQGLSGQRIAIIQQGVKMEGQQWGTDHAPETDAGLSDEVIVVKGAQAVRYGSEAIGGIVLTENRKILAHHLSGQLFSGYQTNGRGFHNGAMLEKAYGEKATLGWRIGLNHRKNGNYQTPAYYLGNTAAEQFTGNLQVDLSTKHWNAEFYGSIFLNQTGIFKGSHISSPEGIRNAINRPDSTYQYNFSYAIDRPYQQIRHYLASTKLERTWNESHRTSFTFNHQTDTREEFDLLRSSLSGCSSCPQLYFQLNHNQLEINHKINRNKQNLQFGWVGFAQTNVVRKNILVPNFRVYQSAVYGISTWYIRNLTLEMGLRLEVRQQQIFRYTDLVLENPKNRYFNYMASAGAGYQFNSHLHVKLNTQLSQRAPLVNELYTNGVHHGTASFEAGNAQLNPEKIWNSGISVHYKSKTWEVLLNGFCTYSSNFIYLSPQGDSIITTIRGPFPFFAYKASEVLMRGADALVTYNPVKAIRLTAKGALIRSWNISDHNFLIFQPADQVEIAAAWEESSKNKDFQFFTQIGTTMVRRQNRAPEGIDFTNPPPGYLLWNMQVGLSKSTGKFRFDLSLDCQNITDLRYRNYMNRLRYFAYEPGRNWTIRLKLPF